MRGPLGGQVKVQSWRLWVKLFKAKLEIEAAMRLVLGAALRRDPDATLADIAQSGTLTPEDIATVKRELLPFDLALWHLLFLQLAAKLGAEELTSRFTISLALASKDIGEISEQASSALEGRMSSALSYLQAASEKQSDRYKDAGPGFFYCQEFADRVLPQVDLLKGSAHDRHFQVFDIAKQSLREAETALADLQGEYRIMVR
jgi:hypothetical protein